MRYQKLIDDKTLNSQVLRKIKSKERKEEIKEIAKLINMAHKRGFEEGRKASVANE